MGVYGVFLKNAEGPLLSCPCRIASCNWMEVNGIAKGIPHVRVPVKHSYDILIYV
jgi:hypothetical protein